jgi:hypothetical protein
MPALRIVARRPRPKGSVGRGRAWGSPRSVAGVLDVVLHVEGDQAGGEDQGVEAGSDLAALGAGEDQVVLAAEHRVAHVALGVVVVNRDARFAEADRQWFPLIEQVRDRLYFSGQTMPVSPGRGCLIG